MSAQRKQYLQLAAAATVPRSKLFYELMAELAPVVSVFARRQVNQVGAGMVYDVVMRATAALAFETAFNLGCDESSIEKIAENFKTCLEMSAKSQQIIGKVSVTPKLSS